MKDRKLPRVGSAVLVVENDRLLLGKRNKDPNRGMWVLPGGGVEPFESVNQAATRELREETGLQIEIGEQLGVFEIIEPPEEHRVIVFSWARPIGGSLQASTDISELRFVSQEELRHLELSPIVKAVLKKAAWLPPTETPAALVAS